MNFLTSKGLSKHFAWLSCDLEVNAPNSQRRFENRKSIITYIFSKIQSFFIVFKDFHECMNVYRNPTSVISQGKKTHFSGNRDIPTYGIRTISGSIELPLEFSMS